ncbi:MAG: glycosyltransferase [Azospirillaceae bacterium]
MLLILSVVAAAAWVYLLLAHGRFWRADQTLDRLEPAVSEDPWPSVAAIIPARDEAPIISRSLRALAAQDYPGPLEIVLVDDHSSDGTGAVADGLAVDRPCTVLHAPPLAAGWSGKLWAVNHGLAEVARRDPPPDYVLLTDADIAHAPDSVRRLVAVARDRDAALVSVMARLDCRGFWERLLIPAFVFFFQKLYPFPRVNDPASPAAAAAGGCALVRRRDLDAIGGIAAIRGALIDDVALARAIKAPGPGGRRRRILLMLADTVASLRPYEGYGGVRDMVVRTAYTQLRHSPLLLAGTLVGMALLYLAGPLTALTWPLHGQAAAALAGAGAWATMAVAYRPTLRRYGGSWFRALGLPLAGLWYTVFTVESAVAHARGRGGLWKGRRQAPDPSMPLAPSKPSSPPMSSRSLQASTLSPPSPARASAERGTDGR